MNVTIQIKFLSDAGRVYQSGTFPLRRRKPEEIAYEWLQQIKRKVTYQKLISVIVDGNEDITGKVLEMEKAPLD
ncbi:hypothetical protein M3204_13850 [Mesobacillus subterraneus]|uniref:hypothetical protein n=1 Tax=Mesobacillus subterraneus TaxID=285983 RepID=UPI002041EBF2|nr:hypothetical protein [Mesobacillus subterraneus]MCM3665496.1 hypothetical protein [Mesobacillus subterraneus]MCM3686055.1 hypothetical protein [Mesobacillus subterraneus]